jgi:hypothetical protein
LKREFRGQWEKWNAESAAIFTKAGNRKRPPYDISFQMISKAVKTVSKIDLIRNAFISCGFHCYHQTQKAEGDNISLTFNDRMKANFFNVDDITQK